MKRKKEKYLPLDFAQKTVQPDTKDFGTYEEYLSYSQRNCDRLRKVLLAEDGYDMDAKTIAPILLTINNFLKFKQAYRITNNFAKVLFESEGMDFSIGDIKMPFPTIYLDFGDVDESALVPKGAFCTITEIPFFKGTGHLCSILLLFQKENGDIDFDGAVFDYSGPSHSVEEKLQQYVPEKDKAEYCRHVLQFAAYLSSYKPDVEENPEQKRFYKKSDSPKLSSIKKWDVGRNWDEIEVRYKAMRAASRKAGPAQDSEDGPGRTHASPRPHIRRGHWHTYKVGPGRTEKRLKWLPPVMVGKGEITTVVNKVTLSP